MKNLFKKTARFLMVAIMIMSMCVPAFAEYTQPLDTEHAKVTINKHLIMDEYATVPTVDFKFTVANGEAGNGVLAGFDADKVVVGEASFTKDTTTGTDTVDYEEVTLESGEKFATVQFEIDFSAVEFTQPGVYRYVLTETADFREDMTYDTVTRYVDVYVENNDTNDGLVVSSILVSKGEVEFVKSNSFINEYETYDLDLKKIIAGNQANMNDKFEFSIIIYDAPGTVTITTSDQTTTTIPSRNTPNAEGAVIELGHNDIATIHALPYGTKVTITENNGDYVATYTVGQTNGEGSTLTEYEITEDTSVVFTNTKTGTIPTGIFLAVGPMVGIAALGGIGMMVSKKNRKDED